jgi:hypothetical protein
MLFWLEGVKRQRGKSAQRGDQRKASDLNQPLPPYHLLRRRKSEGFADDPNHVITYSIPSRKPLRRANRLISDEPQ